MNSKTYLWIIFIILFICLFVKIDFKQNREVLNENFINGTYTENINRFIILSFDSKTKEYFYYDVDEMYKGKFIYLDNGEYKIVDGKLENYFIKVIDIKTIEIYNNDIKRIFSRESYDPTIINEKF